MMLCRRLIATSVSLLACGICSWGQAAIKCAATQRPAAPYIDKIDPPGWWVGLPSPMLLIHGHGLKDAQFVVTGKGVTLARTQSSENGHWTFLWLETSSAAPQTIEITAKDAQGEVRHAYTLAARSRDPRGHSGFSNADVLYLIMPDRFAHGDSASNPPGDDRAAPHGWHGGNLAGIEQHLDYLKQLGVTTVWITPVVDNQPMPGTYHGYAATDLYAIDPHFGTLSEYRRLSESLHARGMKLVIDLVPNHIGVEHLWVADPPAPNWLHGTSAHHRSAEYEFYKLLDPHAPPSVWSNVTDGWFADNMPDLNQENPLVEKYLIQNALWWVEMGNLDGIRLDTFPYVSRAYWHDFHTALREADPRVTTVGEIFHPDPEVVSFFAGGAVRCGAEGCIDSGLYTPFDFPVHFALRDVLAHGKPMTELADVLRQDSLYPHPERLVTFIGNHDTTRFITEAGGSVAMLRLAQGLTITLRGTPLIYSGDEIGMVGGKDPDDRHDFPGGFPGDVHDAFTRTGRTAQEQDIFSWTSEMLALRKKLPALEGGSQQDLFADNDAFAFVRSTAGESGCDVNRNADRVFVVVNKAAAAETIDLPLTDTALAGCSEFAVEAPAMGAAPTIRDGKLQVEEPPESMTVYEVK